MAIPLKFNIVKSKRTNPITDLKLGKGEKWVAWWYGGIVKNNRAKSQPYVKVLFRQLLNNKISSELVFRNVLLTYLGQVRLGSIWQDDVSNSKINYQELDFNVNFSQGSWIVTSLHDCIRDGVPVLFDTENYPLFFKSDKTPLISFQAKNGKTLIIPCLEFFSRCYGRSQELKRVLMTYPWRGQDDSVFNRFYAPIDEPEEKGIWKVKLKKRLHKDDVVFLAHAKYDDYTQTYAKRIYAQIEKQFGSKGSNEALQIKIYPWHQGDATIKVSGLWVGNSTFLGLNILGCTDPVGNEVHRDRENTNKTLNPADSASTANGWLNAPKFQQATPPIQNLTSIDEPDHGAPSVELLDPDFIRIGNPRVVLDMWKERAKSSSTGENKIGGDVNVLATGDPYGINKGVGYASIVAKTVMESEGLLLDMWKAMLHLKQANPYVIKRVQWFTFDHEFQEESPPKLIPIPAFKLSNTTNIEGSKRNWPYIDVKNNVARGLLVMRLEIQDEYVYLLEIQRRTKVSETSEDKVIDEDSEKYEGFIFIENNLDIAKKWISEFLDLSRNVKGVVKNITHHCTSKNCDTFRHSKASTDQVSRESAATNALSKVGIFLKS